MPLIPSCWVRKCCSVKQTTTIDLVGPINLQPFLDRVRIADQNRRIVIKTRTESSITLQQEDQHLLLYRFTAIKKTSQTTSPRTLALTSCWIKSLVSSQEEAPSTMAMELSILIILGWIPLPSWGWPVSSCVWWIFPRLVASRSLYRIFVRVVEHQWIIVFHTSNFLSRHFALSILSYPISLRSRRPRWECCTALLVW